VQWALRMHGFEWALRMHGFDEQNPEK